MGPIVAAFYSVVGRLLAEEIKAWLPWITEQLTRIAVRGLPGNLRERYAEEWRSHLSEIPGELSKVAVALGFIRATLKSSAGEYLSDAITRAVALGMILLNVPLFLIMCVVVKFGSPGPFFQREELVGFGGRRFHRLSFRTPNNSAGRFLQKWGLAQLPVIFNIVRGELAFVGPAPIWPDLAEVLDKAFPDFKLRFKVKPGLTGWFQVTHTDTHHRRWSN